MTNNIKCLVVIPTYNEIDNIDDIIAAVLRQGAHYNLLVVDDNSPDGTGQRVKELSLNNDKLHLLQRSGKLGLGTAYIAGFKYGIEHKFDYIFEMDADFSHNPNDLPRLLEPCLDGSCDFTIGSRYVKGGGISNWSKYRLFLSYSASIYVRLITWMPIKDATAGFMCYKVKVLQSIDLDNIKFTGYAFQIEMKFAAFHKKFKWKEVPIIFSDRIKGTSKMSANIVSEAIKGVLGLRLKSLMGFYK